MMPGERDDAGAGPVGAAVSELRTALHRGMPFLVSAFPIGMIFGALAAAGGLSRGQTLAMSGFVYSGAAQFTGLELLTSGAVLPVIVLVTLLLSLRLLVYALALVDEVRKIPLGLRLALACGMTDQVFFIMKERIAEGVGEYRKRAFFVWCVLLFYVNWLGGTALGMVIGDRLAVESRNLGLDFVAYAVFVGMLRPYLRSGPAIAACLVTAAVVIGLHALPYGSGLLLSCATAVAVVMTATRLGRVWTARRRRP